MKKTYEVENIFSSEIFDCEYATGYTESGRFVYVWSQLDIETYTNEMIESPTCFHGAMVGTLEEITEEIEECVGSFRYIDDGPLAEESALVVETLLEGLE